MRVTLALNGLIKHVYHISDNSIHFVSSELHELQMTIIRKEGKM